MELSEFLAMIAFENATSGTDLTPTEYGYTSWRDMYDVVSEVEATSFTTPTGETIWLTEEESWTGDLRGVLQKSYNEAAWVLKRAKDNEVVYE